MKKAFIIIFLGGLFFPLIILAVGGTYTIEVGGTNYNITYEGLVPCGRCVDVFPYAIASVEGECGQELSAGGPVPVGTLIPRKYVNCTICHIFVMMDGIIDFVLLKIVPPVAALLLIVSGIAFFQAGASPERFSWAKSVLMSTIIGIVIIYTSWIIVSTTLDVLGISNWVGFGSGWFEINCEIKAGTF